MLHHHLMAYDGTRRKMRSLSDYPIAVYRTLSRALMQLGASGAALIIGVLLGGLLAYSTGMGGMLSATPLTTPLGAERSGSIRVEGKLDPGLFEQLDPMAARPARGAEQGPKRGPQNLSFKDLATRPDREIARPKIAIVIDDLGLDPALFNRVNALPGPLTLSFLPYASGAQPMIDKARASGHHVMLHLPMEPLETAKGHYDPGPGALLNSDTPDELARKLAENLARFSGYDGVNNHMGSRLTGSRPAMEMLLGEIDRRGLFFLDSVTRAGSMVSAAADNRGLKILTRDLFLDADHGQGGADSVRQQLRKLEELALIQGQAIAIAHPHGATLEALGPWLVTVQARGFELVPAKALVPPSTKETKALAALR